jgi:hypothetical protein
MLLAGGKSTREAAAECGLSERTARRWAGDVDFGVSVMKFRSAILAETVGKLASIGGRAVDVLAELLTDESAGVRLRTAAVIFANLAPGFRAIEERQAVELAQKALHHAKLLDNEWARLKLERQQLDAERQQGGNGAGGPHGR